MGLLLDCNGVQLHISYEKWHEIRKGFAEATILYLRNMRDLLNKDIVLNSDGVSSQVNETAVAKINTILETTMEDETDYFDYLCKIFHENKYNMEILIGLGLSGIIALLCKCDCEGYYSIGNSYDILDMIDIVKDFIQDTKTLDYLDNIIELFKISVNTKTLVGIN
jgi:hypothetical protein